MARVLIVLAVIFDLGLTQDLAQNEFANANELMKQELYFDASSRYESLLLQGYKHPDLYYNLGNSYFKQGRYGNAIWAYENAKLLDPLDPDIAYNLILAETRIKDRIVEPDTFIVLSLYRSFRSQIHFFDSILAGSLALFLAIVIYVITRYINFRKSITSNIIGILFFVSILFHGLAIDKYWGLSTVKKGVIIIPECSAYSIPLERAESTLFILHEGSKGTITQEQEGWVEIELLDGNKGWIRSNAIRKIDQG